MILFNVRQNKKIKKHKNVINLNIFIYYRQVQHYVYFKMTECLPDAEYGLK